MTCKSIITIGRQYGSGGHEIGQKLAKELGIKCYDKELLDRAAKESGICQELFEHHDERPTNSFLYSLVMDTYSMNGAASGYTEMPLNYKVFLAQFNAIKQIAKEGPCVMIGRCADYALADFDNCISIFVHADMDKRIKRIRTGGRPCGARKSPPRCQGDARPHVGKPTGQARPCPCQLLQLLFG